MTFISSIKTNQGIVLSADSKELLQGGYLLWEDFQKLLNKKSETENSQNNCICPNELNELFQSRSLLTKGRIRSIDGVKKIFQITNHIAILISGKANPGGQEFSTTVSTIKNKINTERISDFNEIVEAIFEETKIQFQKDKDDKLDSEHIICGYDLGADVFKVFKLDFRDKFTPDGNGGWLKDKDGNTIREKVLYKTEFKQVLTTGGMTNCIRELSEFNSKNPSLTLDQAFNLSKQILKLAVTIEEYTELIPAIGGQIYFATITKKGFCWLAENESILNHIE